LEHLLKGGTRNSADII